MKKKYSIVIEIFCFLFILLFIYTGVNKLTTHKTFSDQLIFVTKHQGIGNFLSYLIPIAELITALLIAMDRTRIAGLYLFVTMIACFTAYIILLLMSDRTLPCSCGGVISSMTWKQHLWFNVGFLLAGIASILVLTSHFLKKSIDLNTTSF